MQRQPESTIFLAKALESLAGAESEYANERYNNCANRCYYACFQAAVAALMQAGVRPGSDDGLWGHSFVQAAFVGELINRRKLYPAELRGALEHTYKVRETADYRQDHVIQMRALRSLRRARALVEAVRGQRR